MYITVLGCYVKKFSMKWQTSVKESGDVETKVGGEKR